MSESEPTTAPVELTELASRETESGVLRILLSPDKQRALLKISHTGGPPPRSKHVFDMLEEHKVSFGVRQNTIDDTFEALTENPIELDGVVIAEGLAPTQGQDAKATLHFNPKAPRVEPGAVLVTMNPPSKGDDGQDIFGQPIPAVPGRPIDVKVLYGIETSEDKREYKAADEGFAVFVGNHLTVSENFVLYTETEDTEAHLSYVGEPVTKQDVTDFLNDMGVRRGLINEGIEQLVGGPAETPVKIAQGTLPIQPKPAELDYKFERRDKQALKQDASGKIDYKNQNRYDMVDAESILLHVVHAQQGTAGIDVFGIMREVPEIEEVHIVPGENVRSEETETGRQYIAEIRGVPEQNENVLSVTNVLVVEGDLDLSIGNIDFEGDVSIRGMIPDGFSIKTDGNLRVGGTVGAVNLIVKKDIDLNSGFKGKDKGKVLCDGGIVAKYVDDINVEMETDLNVMREIVGSHVYTRGNITCAEGVLVGGETYALAGLEVGTLGSEAYVRTVVVVGEDYKLMRFREEWDPKLKKMVEEEADLSGKLAQLKRNPQIIKRMTPAMKGKFKAMLVRLKEIAAIREEVTQQLGEKQAEAMSKRVGEIRVNKLLYPGTYIKIGFSEQEVKNEMKGPLIIYEDLENQRIAYKEPEAEA